MSKKLAIKGHPIRGKEVIELLEMMGGKNIHKLEGNTICVYYIIEGFEREIRIGDYIFDDEDICFFTLEEFWEKYPYRVGDVVVYTKFGEDCNDYPIVIKSMKWTGTTMEYGFDGYFTCLAKDLKMWKLKDNHTNVSEMKSVFAELLEYIKTTPKDELEREFEEIKEWSNIGPTVEEFRTFCECVNKKSVYPTTFEECLNTLYSKSILKPIVGHKAELLLNLEKLLICRDAYWKVAGEQMGLDKPWEPDWMDETAKCGLMECQDAVIKNNVIRTNRILVFPTKEMRDAFYENFKDLIEQCKELL